MGTLIRRYEHLVRGGILREDVSQQKAISHLEVLLQSLVEHSKNLEIWKQSITRYERKKALAIEEELSRRQHREQERLKDGYGRQRKDAGLLGGLWTNFLKNPLSAAAGQRIVKEIDTNDVENYVISKIGAPPKPPKPPKGVYLYGSVGSGKTMLMDMFHEFALEFGAACIHKRLHSSAAWLEFHSYICDIEKRRTVHENLRVVDRPDRMAKLAKLAQRRLWRERLNTPADVFQQKLASSNADVMKQAARGLLEIDNMGSLHIWDPCEPIEERTTERARKALKSSLLCFDEVQTTDPFTAAALKAVFEAAISAGGVIVATSNRPPGELSSHGLHEAMFAHLQESIEKNCSVIEVSSPHDYRRLKFSVASTSYSTKGKNLIGIADGVDGFMWPLNDKNRAALLESWNLLAATDGVAEVEPLDVPVAFGRTLRITRRRGRAALFDFHELCDRPLGSADYSALSRAVDILFLENIPAMSTRRRDWARRFITLIDELYEQKCRLVCTAAVPIDELFADSSSEDGYDALVVLEGLQSERGTVLRPNQEVMAALGGAEEKFASARTMSRLFAVCSSPINSLTS